ncbi:hypothetical protein [Paraburkholderia azotifigens]|uniref:Uncharacterized protein n=1 Tax=Paraburkholderia azotifigens TaxID=2057004 RepID=A0A5C6VBA5_9BURK|nr:hypothetical protein [Paraburkholderia azotifigens]TXC82702.1 hypothetical protein FRZ40_19855 [Paraburkholderia azotifigens]
MKRKVLVAAHVVALALVIFIGGVCLARYLAYGIFYEMPIWMYDSMRFVLDHTGNADLRDPDDISILSMLFSLVACWIIIAIVVITLYRIAMRFVRRTLNSSGQG